MATTEIYRYLIFKNQHIFSITKFNFYDIFQQV